jgi:magnesium-transporting ATPase (P-type)
LFCKGADNVIAERLDGGAKTPQVLEADHNLREFSNHGLRTLMMAYRYLPESEYNAFKKEMDEAERSLVDREQKVGHSLLVR